jgi:hypothetical protein
VHDKLLLHVPLLLLLLPSSPCWLLRVLLTNNTMTIDIQTLCPTFLEVLLQLLLFVVPPPLLMYKTACTKNRRRWRCRC